MKYFPLLIFFILISLKTSAQDTIVVQTLTYDSPTRSGLFQFPENPPNNYRKIIMEYSMRCLDGVVNPGDNSTGCHEWDYSCNTFITDSTTIDSSFAQHPNYIINNYSGNTFNYTSQPTFTHYQYTQQEVIYNGTNSENTYVSGSGSNDLNHPFPSSYPTAKNQYLWTASELSNIGLSAGEITSLRMDISTLGSNLDFLKIKMKSTSANSMNADNPELTGFTEVYFLNTTPSAGINNFNFHTPFIWDGSSSILVEFSYYNTNMGNDNLVKGNNTGFNAGLTSSNPDYYLYFNNIGHIDLPTDHFNSISNGVTISFWAFGNENIMPSNSTIFEGMDGEGRRQANVHLPWGNGRIYWDCGNDGSGYDRIEKDANLANYAGQWNHWAFTKDAGTGAMKIYLNGDLWHSGTGKTKPINITDFRVGASVTWINKYYGAVNEFRIWDKEIPQSNIQAWMYKDIAPSHPDYQNLVAYYKMDETSGQTTLDSSPNAATATIAGYPARRMIKGEDISRNLSATNIRPNITFVRGTYNQSIQENNVIVSEMNLPNAVTDFSVINNELSSGNTIYVWEAEAEYTYDENGNVISSSNIPIENTIVITDLDYYIKRPGKYEIMSFVTPYGFGLNLGPNGKKWEFDVTDFAPILTGSKYLNMELGGEYNEEIDIRFLFITGTPPRDVKSIQNIWPFARGYYNSIMDNSVFEPRSLQIPSDGNHFKIRNTITGHGQNGEFTSRNHYLNLDNGAHEFNFEVWKECAENPVYPQGGTWIFDRAGWCPGMPTDLREFDITPFVTPGGSVLIDYGVVPSGNTSETNYLVNNQLVTYGLPNFSLDAEIIAIKRPSARIEYARMNSACNNPIVIIKNVGSTPLNSVDITYSIEGGEALTHNWTGNLEFLESTEVTLPTPDYAFWQNLNGEKEFSVYISNPNGGTDENSDNDNAKSSFFVTDKYEGSIRFNYKTNNRAFQNAFRVKDHNGNIVLERTGMLNATTYNDDLSLVPGCYTVEFTDTGDDGLDFWYWAAIGQNVGTGNFRIMRNNMIVKTFNPDFGNDITYDFFVEETVSNQDLTNNQIISISPNPTSGNTQIELSGWQGEKINIELIDITGKRLFEKNHFVIDDKDRVQISLEDFPNGIYLIKIRHGDTIKTTRIIKQ